MIEWVEQFDHQLLLFINHAHAPWLDQIMWSISNKFVWFPLYLILFILVYLKYSWKHALIFTLLGFAAVGLADFTATFGIKEVVARYRPSHHPILGPQLHFYEFKPGEWYKGGQYGFVSGHATNSFVIAWMFILQLRHKFKYITPFLLIWAIVVCYSRMYLGVHYPSDIIGGTILGTAIAFLFHWMYRLITTRISKVANN